MERPSSDSSPLSSRMLSGKRSLSAASTRYTMASTCRCKGVGRNKECVRASYCCCSSSCCIYLLAKTCVCNALATLLDMGRKISSCQNTPKLCPCAGTCHSSRAPHLGVVILPHFARDFVATQIKCLEVHARDLKLLHTCMKPRESIGRGASSTPASFNQCRHCNQPAAAAACCMHCHAADPITNTRGTHAAQARRIQIAKPTSEVGICVGWWVTRRSSLSMCINVVFPALSSPCTMLRKRTVRACERDASQVCCTP